VYPLSWTACLTQITKRDKVSLTDTSLTNPSKWTLSLFVICVHQRSQYYCHFIHIGSSFNHRPNSYHRANRYKKIRVCIVVLAKSVANWKVLSNFILVHFQISWQPRRIRKNRNHQKFLLM